MSRQPLHIQVRNSLIESIERGSIASGPNGALPRQRDLAEQFNVGINTVKRVIRDLEGMGLIESRQGKGIELKKAPNLPGLGSPPDKRIYHIGIVYLDWGTRSDNPVVAELVRGVEDFVRNRNFMLHQLSFHGSDPSAMEECIASRQCAEFDGILFMSSPAAPTVIKLRERGIPMVSSALVQDQDLVCHYGNHITGAYSLISALFRRGARNIVVFCGDRNRLGFYLLSSVYVSVLREYGLELDPACISSDDYDLDTSIEFIRGVLASGRTVDAVVAFDDIAAAGIADYLRTIGRDDILVAGAGNLESLSDRIDLTLDFHNREMGHNAMDSLFKLINGTHPPCTKFIYDPALIERHPRSTRNQKL